MIKIPLTRSGLASMALYTTASCSGPRKDQIGATAPCQPVAELLVAPTMGRVAMTSSGCSPRVECPLQGPRAARGRLRVEASSAPADHDHLARLLMLGPGLRPGEVELIEDVRAR